MNGTGVWAQYLHHMALVEYVALAEKGELNEIYALMHPDQKAVSDNIEHLVEWSLALKPLGVRFYAWIVCGAENPRGDATRAKKIYTEYGLDGIIANAEKAYCDDGFKNSYAFLDALGPMPKGSLGWSTEATHAEVMTTDYRRWELAGATYMPQCYFNEHPASTPESMVKSAYLPEQVHVGWNYRLWIRGQSPRWGLVSDLYTDHIVIRDLRSRVTYHTPIELREGYPYLTTRILSGGGDANAGKILGFFPRGRIAPVLPGYEVAGVNTTPAKLTSETAKAKVKLASLYLAETGGPTRIKAVHDGLLA